ncbi:MAG: hypothetical protein D6773_04135 [Alphaproteobacteria bacterium]|nr:MAG: hypothetical protein D6773_04135 [Alphaproteobacteria bacterium]
MSNPFEQKRRLLRQKIEDEVAEFRAKLEDLYSVQFHAIDRAERLLSLAGSDLDAGEEARPIPEKALAKEAPEKGRTDTPPARATRKPADVQPADDATGGLRKAPRREVVAKLLELAPTLDAPRSNKGYRSLLEGHGLRITKAAMFHALKSLQDAHGWRAGEPPPDSPAKKVYGPPELLGPEQRAGAVQRPASPEPSRAEGRPAVRADGPTLSAALDAALDAVAVGDHFTVRDLLGWCIERHPSVFSWDQVSGATSYLTKKRREREDIETVREGSAGKLGIYRKTDTREDVPPR